MAAFMIGATSSIGEVTVRTLVAKQGAERRG